MNNLFKYIPLTTWNTKHKNTNFNGVRHFHNIKKLPFQQYNKSKKTGHRQGCFTVQ